MERNWSQTKWDCTHSGHGTPRTKIQKWKIQISKRVTRRYPLSSKHVFTQERRHYAYTSKLTHMGMLGFLDRFQKTDKYKKQGKIITYQIQNGKRKTKWEEKWERTEYKFLYSTKKERTMRRNNTLPLSLSLYICMSKLYLCWLLIHSRHESTPLHNIYYTFMGI